MIVVTGGAGFIGSNIVKSLNERGRKDILVVDNLQDGTKFRNLVDCEILDYVDQEDFLRHIDRDEKYLATVEAIFHEGACSSTTEWDGRFMMENNYAYTKKLLHFCLNKKIQFIYASSASVYGGGSTFKEDREHESPLNVYGYSKFLFDQYVRRLLINTKSQVVGLRYFNVYGPREQHKGSMASVAFHFNRQLLAERKVKLFKGLDGYQDGEQRRDFIYVGDVADINLFFLDHPDRSGIFNAGTGRSQSFNDVARAVISYHGFGDIEYVPFPENLKGRYQSFTQSDISSLRHAGYQKSFKSVEEGVLLYMHWLNTK